MRKVFRCGSKSLQVWSKGRTGAPKGYSAFWQGHRFLPYKTWAANTPNCKWTGGSATATTFRCSSQELSLRVLRWVLSVFCCVALESLFSFSPCWGRHRKAWFGRLWAASCQERSRWLQWADAKLVFLEFSNSHGWSSVWTRSAERSFYRSPPTAQASEPCLCRNKCPEFFLFLPAASFLLNTLSNFQYNTHSRCTHCCSLSCTTKLVPSLRIWAVHTTVPEFSEFGFI